MSNQQKMRPTDVAPDAEDARSIDHAVAVAADLEAAGDTYAALGFQTLPTMRHIEIGTANRIIQFKRTYLEFVSDIDRGPRFLSDRILPRLTVGPGLAMLSLTTTDLAADRDRLIASGVPADPILNARRRVPLPNGADMETDSSSSYTWNKDGDFASLFLSEHRRPEAIWIPSYQQHPNTVDDIIAITYLVDAPRAHRDYFTALLRSHPARDDANELTFRTPRQQQIELLTRSALQARYGAVADSIANDCCGMGVALTFAVRNLDAARQILGTNSIAHHDDADTISIPADSAAGIVLIFRRASIDAVN